jgi:hypothetical protein
MFESALRIAANDEIPCRGRMIAHAYREICSEIMNRYSPNSREDMRPLLDELADEFERLELSVVSVPGPGATQPVEGDPGPVTMPQRFVHAVGRVVALHRSAPKGRDRALAVFEGMRSGTHVLTTDIVPIAERWFHMLKFFAGHVHDRKTDDAVLLHGDFKDEAEFFEATLNSFAISAIGNLDELDLILEDANK